MATIPSIKTTVNANIRTETAAGGITPGEVSDILDSVLHEVRDRGILWVADATAVAAADPLDSKHVGDISTGIVYRHNGSSYVAILTPGGGGGGTTLSTPTLTASVISSTQIDLSWTNVANESSYMLEWSPNGTSGWTQIGGTIAANTTTYSHTGLTPSTAYFYRVKAVGDGVTYLDSGYGTDNDTTSAGAETITWNQLTNTTNTGGGTVTGANTTTPAGATASKKVTKANGNYVEFTCPATLSDCEAVVLCMDDSNDADYTWTGSPAALDVLGAVYQFAGDIYTSTNDGDSAADSTFNALAGDVLRLEISGDDILVKQNGTTRVTLTGALTGISNIYVKAIFAVNSTAKKLETCTGLGLVTI